MWRLPSHGLAQCEHKDDDRSIFSCTSDTSTEEHTITDQQARATVRANGVLGVTFGGRSSWTFSSSAKGVYVYILVSGTHSYILIKDAGTGFTLSTDPGTRYQYLMCDRLFDEQKHRMIKDINTYNGYSSMTEYYVGKSMALSDSFVKAVHEDIKKLWAKDWKKPAMDGSEAFCLLYVLNVCHHLGVLRDVTPFDADAWTAEDMRTLIRFLDPGAPNGRSAKRARR